MDANVAHSRPNPAHNTNRGDLQGSSQDPAYRLSPWKRDLGDRRNHKESKHRTTVSRTRLQQPRLGESRVGQESREYLNPRRLPLSVPTAPFQSLRGHTQAGSKRPAPATSALRRSSARRLLDSSLLVSPPSCSAYINKATSNPGVKEDKQPRSHLRPFRSSRAGLLVGTQSTAPRHSFQASWD